MRIAVFVVFTTLLSAGPARADEAWNAYAAGMAAANRQAWVEAIADFRRAIALDPTERAAGVRGEPYLPHYRLGLALEHTGQTEQARVELLESERQGVVHKTTYNAEFRSHLSLANTRRETFALTPTNTAATARRITAPPPPMTGSSRLAIAETAPQPPPVPPTDTAVSQPVTAPPPTVTAAPQPATVSSAPVESEFAAIDHLFAKLSPGKTLFDPPADMNLGRTVPVVARIGAAGEDANIGENLPHGDATTIKQEHITPSMLVTLSGDAFDITTASPTEQLIGGGSYTEWRWDVKPKSSGSHRLDLHVVAILRLEGVEKQKELNVTSRKVLVHASPWYSTKLFITSNWAYLLSTIIIPLVIFLYRSRGKRKTET